MSRNKWILLLIILFILVIVFSTIYFINKNNVSNSRDKINLDEMDIIELLKNNTDIVDYLENTIYSYEDDIFIKYKNSKIEFYINGKIQKIEEDQENILISVFTELYCENLRLYKEKSSKILRIFMGSVFINKNNVYEQCIIYTTDKYWGFNKELLPNWYYDVLFYT